MTSRTTRMYVVDQNNASQRSLLKITLLGQWLRYMSV